MVVIKNGIMYFLSFKSYVVLPVIIFTLAMIFRMKITMAIKSAMTIGIGFIGIFMTFDYFVKIVNPVVKALIQRTGLHFNVLDAGWPPLAAITWSFKLAPLLLLLFMTINIVMLILKKTRTVDIDIWNYWHVILAGTMIYNVTKSPIITVLISSLVFIMVLKLAEWSAPMVNEFSGMSGISIPHLGGIIYFPIALVINKILDKIPVLNKIDANPEKMQKKLGLLGEPMVLGFLIGTGLGIGAGYNIKTISDLAFGFAAVIYILPKMCGILGTALIPISEGMKEFISKKYPDMGHTYIGLDVAVLFGIPSVVVTTLMLIPTSIFLAFVLPGINFIPLGDLVNTMVPVAFICVVTRGNIIRSYIIGIPVVIGNLYLASNLANFFTKLSAAANYHMTDYNGTFTSYLDGGNLFRGWLVKLMSGNFIAVLLLPVVIGLLIYTWRATRTRA